MRRGRALLAAATVALACGAIAVPTASAQYENVITFKVAYDGTTAVSGTTRERLDHAYVEVLRNGAATTNGGWLTGGYGGTLTEHIKDLLPGDEASFYTDGRLLARGIFTSAPQIEKACVGSTSFVVGASGAEIEYAGTRVEPSDAYMPFDPAESTWRQPNPGTVLLARPIAANDIVYAATTSSAPGMKIRSERSVRPEVCPPPPPAPPAPPPASAEPTDAVVLRAVKTAAAATGAELRRHKQLAKLPFAFPEPGSVQLKLSAKGRMFASGVKKNALAGDANVTVKLTSAGRKLLKRSKTLKLTLTATFTPSRANAKAQRAVVKVTLKR